MSVDIQSPFLSTSEAAQYLRLKKRTLDNMRWLGVEPCFRKHGGRVFYEIGELTDWSLSRKCQSTTSYWYEQRDYPVNTYQKSP